MADERPIIVIKKIKKGGHGHHGGAWKIAYADFVTAMMAFFLLMWLLSVSSEETKKGIAAYFTSNVINLDATRGTDGILDGSNNPSPNNTNAQDFEYNDKEEIARTDATDATELGVQPAMNKADDNQLATGPQGKGYDNFGKSRRQSQSLNVGKGSAENQNSTSSESEASDKKQEVAVVDQAAEPEDGSQNASLSKMTQEYLVPSQPNNQLTPDTKQEMGKSIKQYDKKLADEVTEKAKEGKSIEKVKREQEAQKLKDKEAKSSPKRSLREQVEDFKKMQTDLKKEIENDKELKKFESNVKVTFTDKGMQIQIIDDEKTAMFLSGGAEPMGYTKKILGLIANVIKKVDNGIEITGHTDSVPYASTSRYTNWELSSDRANAVRRFLTRRSIDPNRYREVSGKEATQPLLKDNPEAPANRRVSMVLLYDK